LNNQRLYLNGTRVGQMSGTLPIDLNSAALGIGRHVSGIADPFNGHMDEFRIAHVQRSDGWIATAYNNAQPRPSAVNFRLASSRNRIVLQRTLSRAADSRDGVHEVPVERCRRGKLAPGQAGVTPG